MDAASGKFAFTANDAGAHKVCFVNNGQLSRRVVFDFLTGVDAKDYTELAKKEHLQPLEVSFKSFSARGSALLLRTAATLAPLSLPIAFVACSWS